MTTYLVTGGAGFIGSHIAEALVKRGDTVRVFDNFSTGNRDNLANFIDRIDLYEGDITRPADLKKAMQGVDYVFHEAAIASVPRSVADPVAVHEAGGTGTLNVLVAARDAGVKRVMYAASSAAYGDAEGKYKTETSPIQPLSPYAVAKLIGEEYCQVFHRVYGLETVALRYFNVFGPRQDPHSEYSAVIPLFISALVEGRTPTIFGDGTQSRDFTYIGDIVRGNLLAASAPREKVAGQVINLAVGESFSLLDLINTLNRVMGKSVTPNFAPARAGDVKHSCSDISKAGELLGYEPTISFEDGLAETVRWFNEQSVAPKPA